MDDVKVGSVVIGQVTGIEEYGIFVKINDKYNGLVHISEMSEKYVKNTSEYANINEKIYVEILKINEKTGKCILSIKNINYRMNENSLIKESVRGFFPLKKHLPIWIKEKNNVMDKKNN